jgi:hypothetical protein
MEPNENNSPSEASQSSASRLGGNKSGVMNMKNGSNKKILMGIGLLVVLAVVIAGVIAWKQMGSSGGGVKSGQYQALFLTNGQVYFGKLSNVDDRYVRLNDIYYLQVQQAVQPAQGTDQQQPKVSLAKLGSELHGPEDEMLVNRDQVLFWENLKNDGKVAKAIADNKK